MPHTNADRLYALSGQPNGGTMSMSRCTDGFCGADDCVRCRGTHEVNAFHHERALESVVETVMLFGQYPQPRRVGMFFTTGSNAPKEFDLYEFLEPQDKGIEFADLLEYFILSMNDYSTWGKFSDMRNDMEKKLTKILTAHLADSYIVQQAAAEDEREEREDH